MLVGVETRDELALVDPATLRITRRISLPGCDANHSLGIDAAARLLIVGCSGNGRLLVLDADSAAAELAIRAAAEQGLASFGACW